MFLINKLEMECRHPESEESEHSETELNQYSFFEVCSVSIL